MTCSKISATGTRFNENRWQGCTALTAIPVFGGERKRIEVFLVAFCSVQQPMKDRMRNVLMETPLCKTSTHIHQCRGNAKAGCWKLGGREPVCSWQRGLIGAGWTPFLACYLAAHTRALPWPRAERQAATVVPSVMTLSRK